MSLVELQGVGFRQGRRMILRNVNLVVNEGDSLGIIGPNGCGKSILLEVLATILRPSEGRVLVMGFDTRQDARSVRRRVGYVPETLGAYPGMTVWQYLSFFAHLAGLNSLERKTTLETLLQVVDLHDHRQREAERLSRGMRRRLALARALVHNPSLLLLDDPLGGLDGRGRLELIEVLRELQGMGVTLIMTGHLLGDIVRLCTHVTVMREGHIARTTPVLELERRESAASRRVELDVLLGEDLARDVLSRTNDVKDLQVDRHGLSFEYHGDAAGLATLLDQLVGVGVAMTRFGPVGERFDEIAASLIAANGKSGE